MQERRVVLLTYPEPFTRDEFGELALAAEYHPSSVKTSKNLAYSKYGVDEGKALEIKEPVKSPDASVILIDETLRSSQEYNLAKLAGSRSRAGRNSSLRFSIGERLLRKLNCRWVLPDRPTRCLG